MTPDEYRELGRFIWRTYVPKRGQSTTVQGELLRANEKLRDECLRSGNANWDDGHEILAAFLLDTLSASPDFTDEQKNQLRTDIERIRDFEHPYPGEDLFNRVEQLLLDWCHRHPEPVPREINPRLLR